MTSGGQSGQWSPMSWAELAFSRKRCGAGKGGEADLELAGGISAFYQPLIELLEDLLEKQVGGVCECFLITK